MVDWGLQHLHHKHDHDHDHYLQQQQGQGCRKGPWTPEEDKLLAEYVTSHGEGRWSSVAKCAGLNRSGKSCRLRWVNYLRPGLKRGQITPQEEGIILELHSLWGNKWSTIARYLPGRTDNEIKNYWRTHYKKKEKSYSKQDKVKKSQNRKKQPQQQEQQNEFPQLVSPSQDYMNINRDNKQNISSSFPSPSTATATLTAAMNDSFFNNQFNMSNNNVAATSSDHSMIDEGQLWGSLWNLDEDDQRVATDIIEKFNGGGVEAPSCGPMDYSTYSGFYTGGYIF